MYISNLIYRNLYQAERRSEAKQHFGSDLGAILFVVGHVLDSELMEVPPEASNG